MTASHDLVRRYFALDAAHDLDAILALFAADATVADEGQTRQGTDAIRAWRAEVASKYTYTTEILAMTDGVPGRVLVEAGSAVTSPAASPISSGTSRSTAAASVGS